MGLAETAELAIRMNLTGNARAGIQGIKKDLGGVSTKSIAVGAAIGTTMSRLAEYGVRKVVGVVTGGLNSLAELESAVTSVDGAITQMGLTGKLTGAQIAGWANDIEASVGAAFDDKAITQAATTLIRYGKVTDANLRPALVVMTDLAAKTGDVDSAATLLAKALADPAKAAGKLARSGVILTKAEQDLIDTLVEAGDVTGAQTILLDALTKSTKGAAEASQGPYQRSLSVLKDVTEDAQRALATGFLPVIEEIRDILSKELAKKSTLDNIKRFGETLAGGVRSLFKIGQNLPWEQIGDSLKVAAAGARGVLDAFAGLPSWVQTAVLTGWGLNKLTGGAISGALGSGIEVAFKGIFGQFFARGASPANPMWVASVTGGGGGPPVVPTGGGLLATLTKAFLPVAIVGITGQAVLELAEALNPPGAKPSDYTRMGGTGQRGFVPPTKSNPMPVLNMAGISPDERQEHNDTQARLLFLDDRLQAIRDRTQDVKTATDLARINTVAATRTGDAAIVAAIRANRTEVNVRVNVTAASVARARITTNTYSAGHVGAERGM